MSPSPLHRRERRCSPAPACREAFEITSPEEVRWIRSRCFTEANDEDNITGRTAESSMDLPMTPSSSTRATAFVFLLLSTMATNAQPRAPMAPPPTAHPHASMREMAGSLRFRRPPGLRHDRLRHKFVAGVALMPTLIPASVEMESAPGEDFPSQAGQPDLVIAAPRLAQRQRCHPSQLVEWGGAARRGRLPRVVYGSPNRCAPLRIVFVDPMR